MATVPYTHPNILCIAECFVSPLGALQVWQLLFVVLVCQIIYLVLFLIPHVFYMPSMCFQSPLYIYFVGCLYRLVIQSLLCIS